MFGLILRLLVVLLLLRLLLQFVGGLRRGLSGERPRAGSGRDTAGGGGLDLVRDEVCNTFVPRSAALRLRRAGRDEHYCSVACRDKALAAGGGH